MENSTIQYIKLRDNFTKYGFLFSLIKRDGDIAIYSQSKRGKIMAYEIIKIKRHKGFSLDNLKDGKKTYIEPSETYPSNVTWGKDGFTCCSLRSAQKRFELLTTRD